LKKLPPIPNIPEQDQTPLVKTLLVFIEQLAEQCQQQGEDIERLEDEINILKGEKKRPAFKASKLDKETDPKEPSDQQPKKRGTHRAATRITQQSAFWPQTHQLHPIPTPSLPDHATPITRTVT